MSIKEAADGLKNKKFSSVELVSACLKRIKERNREINAFLTVCEDEAMSAAAAADKILSKGKGSALTGIPFGVKDAICVEGVLSAGASKILENYVPPLQATVIKKILSAGGILIGKQNCDTFGHGASNENSMYGPVKNPFDLERVSGGSSGGSAAAIADGQCVFSIGEDTGGSIRQPASFCGVAGLRPSYGRNSRYGIMPMASSLDTVGPLARTTKDIACLMEIMAGRDELDATTVHEKPPKYLDTIEKSIKGLKVGVPKEYFDAPGMDSETRSLVEERIKFLQKEFGVKIVEISLPYSKYAVPVYYILVPSEDSSNLARLDGLRYGARQEAENLDDVYSFSRSAGFNEEVKRRIMIGTFVLSAGYYDAYYKKAQKARTLIIQDFVSAFRSVDAILTPTSPFPAFKVGEKKEDVLAMYLADIFAAPASLAGLPALSVPIGLTSSGLPVGMQIIGPRLSEDLVLNIGNFSEKI